MVFTSDGVRAVDGERAVVRLTSLVRQSRMLYRADHRKTTGGERPGKVCVLTTMAALDSNSMSKGQRSAAFSTWDGGLRPPCR